MDSSEPDPSRRPQYRSGAVARMVRMPVTTLRVWERRYQLTQAALSPSGQRLYSAADLQRLALIKARPEAAVWWIRMESLNLASRPSGARFRNDGPSYADLARFAPPPVRTPHPPTALYMGRLEAARGVDLAIAAMARVRARLPQARLLVLGDGEPAYRQRLQLQVQALQLADAVQLLGPVPHARLPRWLREADVGIAAFRLSEQGRYAMPLKVAEYMAAGVPVVCTAGSAAAGWVQRTGAGLASPFEADALADAILQLLQDPQRHAAARQAGLAAAQDLAWPQVTERMWQLMQPAA